MTIAAAHSWIGYSYTDCCKCGAIIMMTTALYNQRLEDRGLFYCPNGHSQHFIGEREVDRVKRELQQQIQQTEFEKRQKLEARRALFGQKIATGKAKAQHKRLIHRVSCGVCPHCKRTFKQLAAHMKAKHPRAKN